MQKQEKKLPLWWPKYPPIYDISKSYIENAKHGPFFKGEVLTRPLPNKETWIDFLGHKIASPIGVPAGPLLNSQWVAFAAKMGFDIVTYKTIRSKPHPAHPVPNMVYVESKQPLTRKDQHTQILRTDNPPRNIDKLSATNSFGIPSFGHDFLVEDIAKAKQSLAEGQVLIVSVVGTPREGEDFENDFAVATKIAVEGGAQIIEADLSCPNVTTREGMLFTNPDVVYSLSSKLKKAAPHLPLIIKVGLFAEKETLKNVMIAAKKAGVDAICGINTVSMQVMDKSGLPALGEKRLKAGVCGGLIRSASIEFTKWARSINNDHSLGLMIMATGGVTKEEHFDLLFEAGADVAMSALGMMWDPYLGLRYHHRRWEKCIKH